MRAKISLIRQRMYLWRKFRGITTKRALAKALRDRLTKMSRAEAYAYFAIPKKGQGIQRKEALTKRHLRERRMIVTILGEMYHAPLLTYFTGAPLHERQTSFYRRYR